jgi:hypothetical protein
MSVASRCDGEAGETLQSLHRPGNAGPAQKSIRDAGMAASFIVFVVTPAGLILDLPTHSTLPLWSAVGANRFARELFVAV